MLKIITWNIACLPRFVNIFGNPHNRISKIIYKIDNINADIICLQEVFDKVIRKTIINFFKNKYKIHYTVNNNMLLNDGLLILSKYPIIHSENHIFNNSCGEDSFVCKGYQYVLIDYNDNIISIINTHMNADPIISKSNPKIIREKQKSDILNIITNNNMNNSYNFLCGDLNSSYNSDILYNILIELNTKFHNTNINKGKISTYSVEQLDYIIYYGNMKLSKYNISKKVILNESDHNILICDVCL